MIVESKRLRNPYAIDAKSRKAGLMENVKKKKNKQSRKSIKQKLKRIRNDEYR